MFISSGNMDLKYGISHWWAELVFCAQVRTYQNKNNNRKNQMHWKGPDTQQLCPKFNCSKKLLFLFFDVKIIYELFVYRLQQRGTKNCPQQRQQLYWYPITSNQPANKYIWIWNQEIKTVFFPSVPCLSSIKFIIDWMYQRINVFMKKINDFFTFEIYSNISIWSNSIEK